MKCGRKFQGMSDREVNKCVNVIDGLGLREKCDIGAIHKGIPFIPLMLVFVSRERIKAKKVYY